MFISDYIIKMALEINTFYLCMPKMKHFCSTISSMMKSNYGTMVMQHEVFDKIKTRVSEIVPLLEMDFKMERKLEIKNGVITSLDNEKIDKFLTDAQKMNLLKYGKQVIEDAFKNPDVLKHCREPLAIIKNEVLSWFEKYLEVLDGTIDVAVIKAMNMKHEEKCKIPKALYNFTEIEVESTLLLQIENGVKCVPTLRKDGFSAVKNALKEILLYLKKYRRFQQKEYPINNNEVRKWLEEAIDEAQDDENDDHIEYYKFVRDNLGKAMKIIKWNCDSSTSNLDGRSIIDSVDKLGGIFVLADKNYGIALLPIKTMINAEEQMLI